MPGSNKAISACDGIFHQRLLGADRDQLVAGRLCAAVPGFAEERDASLRWRRYVDLWSGKSGCGVRSFPDAFEFSRPRFLLPLRRGGDLLHGIAENVQTRVGVFPGIRERLRIEGAKQTTHI